MMSNPKAILASLILCIVMCIPQSIGSSPASNLLIEVENDSTTQAIDSSTLNDHGPRKKSKKKKGHFLDRKRKMKNGKSCPSF